MQIEWNIGIHYIKSLYGDYTSQSMDLYMFPYKTNINFFV